MSGGRGGAPTSIVMLVLTRILSHSIFDASVFLANCEPLCHVFTVPPTLPINEVRAVPGAGGLVQAAPPTVPLCYADTHSARHCRVVRYMQPCPLLGNHNCRLPPAIRNKMGLVERCSPPTPGEVSEVTLVRPN